MDIYQSMEHDLINNEFYQQWFIDYKYHNDH